MVAEGLPRRLFSVVQTRQGSSAKYLETLAIFDREKLSSKKTITFYLRI